MASVVSAFHFEAQLFARSSQSRFTSIRRRGEQRLDVEMTWTEWVGHPESFTNAFELSAIVIAPAGPQSIFGTVFISEDFGGVGEAAGRVEHFGCQRGQVRAERADFRQDRFDEDTAFFESCEGRYVDRAESDFDDFTLLAFGWIAVPAGGFDVNDKNDVH